MITNEFTFSYLSKNLGELNQIYNLGSSITFTLSCTNFKFEYVRIKTKKVVYVPFKFNTIPIKLVKYESN